MKILVSALEHSANVHLKALKNELADDVEFMGIFDNTLGNPMEDLSSLAIMGIVDALKRLPFFLSLASRMVELAKDADKVLLIDSSGFNLPLAKKLKKRYPDKEIIYYILPQAWAWKKKRIPVLERTIDHLASILPFEKNYYSANAPITYVGHPLLDEISRFKSQLTDSQKIAFMPGSRRTEISKLMPVFKELIRHLDGEFILIIPEKFDADYIQELYGDISMFNVSKNAHQSLYEADFAFICSGTATLEAALIGTPFILSYIAKALDYFIGSRVVKLSHVGLGNIMFAQYQNRELHPEFLQEAVTVENLLHSYKSYDKKRFFEDALSLRNYLEHGSSKNVAKLIEA